MPLRFGLKTGQGLSGYTYDELSSIWRKSEELGLESAWLHDHFLSSTNRASDPTLEAYTTLAALARDTRRLKFGAMVTCVTYRNPAYLAKVAATVDCISKGRFIMGIGTGWWDLESTSYGYTFPPVPDLLGQLREALNILRLMWTEQAPSFDGRYFRITNAQCYPKPAQGHIPIWIGINKGTRTLPRWGVELADGFNSTAVPEAYARMVERAEETRLKTGRRREEVTYSVQPWLLMGTEREIDEIAKSEAKRFGLTVEDCLKGMRDAGCTIGSPEVCARRVRAWIDAGAEYVIPKIVGDTLLWPLENYRDKLIPLL